MKGDIFMINCCGCKECTDPMNHCECEECEIQHTIERCPTCPTNEIAQKCIFKTELDAKFYLN